MRNHIPKIKALHRAIEASLFTIHPVFTYSRLVDAIDLLARLVHDCPMSDDGYEIWNIGEFGSCTVESLIVGAYWHFSQWHEGQWSPGYRALSSLGTVFSPGCSSAPQRGEPEFDTFKALDAMARRALGEPVYSFVEITLGA